MTHSIASTTWVALKRKRIHNLPEVHPRPGSA
jgi:hypothetical protein